MAIGDYSKTTYANGVAPAINATNLNNNENKVKELDTAVDGLETTVSGNTYDIFTLETTVSGLEAREIPVSTTSRIFDLTGDRVPPIPDDPAGVTYLQDEWATTDGWSVVNGAGSVSSGWFKATPSSATTVQVVKSISTSGKLLTARIKRSASGNVLVRVYDGAATNTVKTIYMDAGIQQVFSVYIPGTVVNVQLQYTSSSVSDTLEIDWVYIGTGAYLSKTVDRAGVPWTNVGVLPVDGPFGRGLQFNGAQYLQAPGPMIGTTGTVAVKFKSDEISTNQQIVSCHRDGPLNSPYGGMGVRKSINGTVSLEIKNESTSAIVTSSNTINDTNEHTVIASWSPTAFSIYVDGVTTTRTHGITMSAPPYSMFIGRLAFTPLYFMKGTIYAVRADSRVWTDEEIARWSRDPYSEDSGLIDAFSLSFANLPTFADNAAAIAGNLPAGKLYKTSTGNVLVRY